MRLQTDQWGAILLGPLAQVEWLQARVPSSATRIEVLRKWVLPHSRAFPLPKVIELLEDETCQLPLQLSALTRNALSFSRVNATNEPLSDEYSALTLTPVAGQSYSLLGFKSLAPGSYLLTLKESLQRVRVNVHRGVPWEDASFIATPFLLRERQTRRPPLALHDLKAQDDQVSLTVVNPSPDTLVHLVALHFLPYNLEAAFEEFTGLPPTQSLSEVRFSIWRNFFLNCRKLSDEFRYVLDRAHCPPGAANFLEKPTLLLKRLEIGATSFDSSQLAQGAQIEAHLE